MKNIHILKENTAWCSLFCWLQSASCLCIWKEVKRWKIQSEGQDTEGTDTEGTGDENSNGDTENTDGELEVPKEANPMGTYIFIGVAAVIAIVALYFFKIYRKKGEDFEDDDEDEEETEEYENEDEDADSAEDDFFDRSEEE